MNAPGSSCGRSGDVLLLAACVPLLFGCASEPDVPDSVSSRVIERIDTLAEGADCDRLQREFDTADTNAHTDLMSYIDDAMREADCY